MVLCDITEALRPSKVTDRGTAPPGQNRSAGVCKAQRMGCRTAGLGRPAVSGALEQSHFLTLFINTQKTELPFAHSPRCSKRTGLIKLLENQRVRNIYIRNIYVWGLP